MLLNTVHYAGLPTANNYLCPSTLVMPTFGNYFRMSRNELQPKDSCKTFRNSEGATKTGNNFHGESDIRHVNELSTERPVISCGGRREQDVQRMYWSGWGHDCMMHILACGVDDFIRVMS